MPIREPAPTLGPAGTRADLGCWCVVSHRALADGACIGYAYRAEPMAPGDSGWRFFAGAESADECADAGNFLLRSLHELLSREPGLAAILDAPPGPRHERRDARWQPVA